MATLLFNSDVYDWCGTGINSTSPSVPRTSILISDSASSAIVSGGAATGDCVLTIYTGPMPDAFNFVDRTLYDSQILVNFNLPKYDKENPALGSGYRTPYTAGVSTGIKLLTGISQNSSIAQTSGVATWFWLGRNSSLNDMRNLTFIIGTVGPTGSSADLEIPSTAIVAGESYKSVGVYLFLPFKFTI